MSIFKKKQKDYSYDPTNPSKNTETLDSSPYVIKQTVTENTPIPSRKDATATQQQQATRQVDTTAVAKQEQIIKLQKRARLLSNVTWPLGMVMGFGAGYIFTGSGEAGIGLGFLMMFMGRMVGGTINAHYQRKINAIRMEAAAQNQNVSQ